MIDTIQDSLDRAASDQKLSDIDIEYYYEGIQSQLTDLLSVSSKKNYLKKFENKIDNCEDIYEDEIDNIKDMMYTRVIDIIADKFQIAVDKDDTALSAIAKNLYKFFVLEYTNNLTYFFEMYIVENKKDIAKELETIIPNAKRIEGLDSKTSIILNNISETIKIISGSSISFTEYVEYINEHPESSACVNEMIEYDKYILSDTDNFIQSMFDMLLNEEEGFGKIYTDLQLNIFNRYKSEDF